MSVQQNLIHASESVESAKREAEMMFGVDEIFEYESASECLIYSEEEKK